MYPNVCTLDDDIHTPGLGVTCLKGKPPSKAKQSKAKQSKAKQPKAKKPKAKQSKAKQPKAKKPKAKKRKRTPAGAPTVGAKKAKRHGCNICPHAFVTAASLENHKEKHVPNEEKRYQCKQRGCLQKFALDAVFQRHTARNHPKMHPCLVGTRTVTTVANERVMSGFSTKVDWTCCDSKSKLPPWHITRTVLPDAAAAEDGDVVTCETGEGEGGSSVSAGVAGVVEGSIPRDALALVLAVAV